MTYSSRYSFVACNSRYASIPWFDLSDKHLPINMCYSSDVAS